MGEWRALFSLQVRQAFRAELEEFAAREKRKLGNLRDLILERAFDQPKSAGSTQNLVKYGIRRRGHRVPRRKSNAMVWEELRSLTAD